MADRIIAMRQGLRQDTLKFSTGFSRGYGRNIQLFFYDCTVYKVPGKPTTIVPVFRTPIRTVIICTDPDSYFQRELIEKILDFSNSWRVMNTVCYLLRLM
jgi:hypothetical protein